jgi:hypothetical protein
MWADEILLMRSGEKSSVGGLQMIAARTGFCTQISKTSLLVVLSTQCREILRSSLGSASFFHVKRYAIPWAILS